MMPVSIARDGVEIGTWSEMEIQRLYWAGRLVPTDFYWRDGMTEWRPLTEMVQLQRPDGFASAPLPVPPKGRSVPRRTPAAFLLLALAGAILILLVAGGVVYVRKRMLDGRLITAIHQFTAQQKEEERVNPGKSQEILARDAKREAKLAKLKEMSQGESQHTRNLIEAGLEVAQESSRLVKAIHEAEAPLLALGFDPARLTSVEAIDQRTTAIQACQQPIQSLIAYEQNIDTTLRVRFTAAGASAAEIERLTGQMYKSGKAESIIRYWQAESKFMTDSIAYLNLLKSNWGKWRMQGGHVQFDDASMAQSFNEITEQIRKDSAEERAIRASQVQGEAQAPSGE